MTALIFMQDFFSYYFQVLNLKMFVVKKCASLCFFVVFKNNLLPFHVALPFLTPSPPLSPPLPQPLRRKGKASHEESVIEWFNSI